MEKRVFLFLFPLIIVLSFSSCNTTPEPFCIEEGSPNWCSLQKLTAEKWERTFMAVYYKKEKRWEKLYYYNGSIDLDTVMFSKDGTYCRNGTFGKWNFKQDNSLILKMTDSSQKMEWNIQVLNKDTLEIGVYEGYYFHYEHSVNKAL